MALAKRQTPLPSLRIHKRPHRAQEQVRTIPLPALQKSNLPHRTWAFGIYLLITAPKGTASLKLTRDLGIDYKTAWFMAHRIRRAWETAPAKVPIEIDEAYQGGGRKWMNAKRKRTLVDKRTGPAGKLPVVGMRDRHPGTVQTMVMPQLDYHRILDFLQDRTEVGTIIYQIDTGCTNTCHTTTSPSSTPRISTSTETSQPTP